MDGELKAESIEIPEQVPLSRDVEALDGVVIEEESVEIATIETDGPIESVEIVDAPKENVEIVEKELSMISDPIVDTPISTPPPDLEKEKEKTKPKKRLTLQERLALAAKSKKGKGKGNVNANVSVSSNKSSLDIERPSTPGSEIFDLNSNSVEGTPEPEDDKETKNKVIQESQPSSVKADSAELLKKQQMIDQLLKEGETLSKKELKLNQTIKKLRVKEQESDDLIDDLKIKNETLEMSLRGFENIDMKKFESLQKNHDSLSLKNKDLTFKYQDLLNKNWEPKYNAQVEKAQEEELLKKSLMRELSDVKIQFELFRKQTLLKEKDLQMKIEESKSVQETIRVEKNNEIGRLERKIEELRYQTEQSSNSVIDEDYKKLIKNHDFLQSQYTSSQSNWKVIEDRLVLDKSNLENEVALSNKKELQSQKKIKVLTADLKKKISDNSELESKITELETFLEDKDIQLKELSSNFDEFKQKQANLNTIYNKDRTSYLTKIESLESEISKLNDEVSELQITVPSMIELPKRKGSWEIKLGESSSTPHVTRHSSFQFQLPTSASYSQFPTSHSAYDLTNHSISEEPTSAIDESFSTVGNSNIALIGKMSSSVRRLEIELSTLREENVKLANEKSEASTEILHLIKKNESVDQLQGQIDALTKDLEEKSQREKTMLEVIGEKSELVEELRNDVQDLKDLCRLQVQQMMDIQGK